MALPLLREGALRFAYRLSWKDTPDYIPPCKARFGARVSTRGEASQANGEESQIANPRTDDKPDGLAENSINAQRPKFRF